MSTAPPRGRELNAPRRPARAHGALLSRGRAPRPPGSGLAPPPAAAERRAGPPSPPVTQKKRKRGGAQPLLAVTKALGTPTPLKAMCRRSRAFVGPQARAVAPRQGEGVTAPSWGVGEGPRSRLWPGCLGQGSALPWGEVLLASTSTPIFLHIVSYLYCVSYLYHV